MAAKRIQLTRFELDVTSEEHKNRFHELAYLNMQYKNRLISELLFRVRQSHVTGEKADLRVLESEFAPDILLPANIKTCAHQNTKNMFFNKMKDILSGREALPSFRKGSIAVHGKSVKIIKTDDEFYLQLPFYRLSEVKGTDQKTFVVLKIKGKKLDNGRQSLLERTANGDVKISESEIIYKPLKRKYMLHLAYEVPEPQIKAGNGIMGIDMGLNNIFYAAILDTPKRRSDYQSSQYLIQRYKNHLELKKRYGWQLRKEVTTGSGHGKARRLRKIAATKGKFANYRDTYNHQSSAMLVKFAAENGVGTIVMENLGGIRDKLNYRETEKQDSIKKALLNNWAFFDLQQKITYKAKQLNIQVVKIDPQFTSIQCSNCGNGAYGNRFLDKFECRHCGHTAHADYNAALNIAKRFADKTWITNIAHLQRTHTGDSTPEGEKCTA